MRYKHIFFDLDHTLWDFDKNAYESLVDVYYAFELRQFGIQDPDHFNEIYMPINERMWGEYRRGEIDAETVKIGRFRETLKHFGCLDESLVKEVKAMFLGQLPTKGHLMPNTLHTLEQLKGGFKLHLVTNGFKQITDEKVQHSSIGAYFDSVLSAEEVGVLKPNPKVFLHALEMNNASADESLFVGDSIIADVEGAQGVGMDQVFFNRHKKSHESQPTFEIHDIGQILDIL